ncbi:DnaJ domain-containing protein [Xylariaceae sp. FL0016]|nr:DnaJ domain-containing protein [Xylariaceae sp. FL0016]
MSNGPPPDYYKILEIPEDATIKQIRDAYKRAALKTHPDRVGPDSPANAQERASRTRKFQLVNDAYLTLSDANNRRKYDAQRKMFGGSRPSANTDPFEEADEEIPLGGDANAGAGGFPSWAWNFFMGNTANPQQEREQTHQQQFGEAFEEMWRDEDMDNRNGWKIWGTLGGVAGGILGYIWANAVGAAAGAAAGNRLGAVRDKRGKSVYQVFQTMPPSDRMQVLTELAKRVLSHAVSA